MARDKDPSPLFEIIRRADKPSRREMRLPPWMRREAEEAQSGPAGKVDPEMKAAQPEAEPRPKTRVETPDAGRGPAADAGGWLKTPLTFQFSRGMGILLTVAAVATVVAGYLVGQEVGERNAVAQRQAYEETADSLETIREQPPRAGLIPSTVAGVEDDAIPPPPPPPEGAAAPDSGGDSRQPGLNYFRLASIPASSREEGERAVEFLDRNGIDAALIPINNDTLKLVVLRGFTRPFSDPEAQRLEERIRTLGRLWKAQQRGASDWKDMFPEKYRPGVN